MKISVKLNLVPALLGWFERNARDLPWRRTRDPYAVWVSEIMLQQTQVKTVLPYWERWMRALPDIAALAKARPEKLHKLWEGLGYYTRVRNLQKAARLIMERHGGVFPRRFEEVIELPGIGRYTAGAICSIAFNQPTPILDGNVIRVLTRMFGIEGDPREKATNEKLWEIAEELVSVAANSSRVRPRPRNRKAASDGYEKEDEDESKRRTQDAQCLCSIFNQSLMELGALICTPRQPRCGVCPVARDCTAFRQNRTHELPKLALRQPAIPKRFFAFVLKKRGCFLVLQRPAGVVNAHMWEFPNVEVTWNGFGSAVAVAARKQALRNILGVAPPSLEPLCTIKHSITRYRITLEVFRAAEDFASNGVAAQGQWLRLPNLRELPFASAHKKILQWL